MLQEYNKLIHDLNNKLPQSYEAIYKMFYPSLCCYVEKLIQTEEDSQDIVQEVFIAIYEGNHTFLDIKELTNYLYKSCYNNSLIYLRNNNTRQNILEGIFNDKKNDIEDEGISFLMIKEEFIRQLHEAIDKLPKEQQRIMKMRIQGLEWGEIAEKIGVSINTVKTQKTRSFQFLRKYVREEYFMLLILFFY